jgi:hypothetical protein
LKSTVCHRPVTQPPDSRARARARRAGGLAGAACKARGN